MHQISYITHTICATFLFVQVWCLSIFLFKRNRFIDRHLCVCLLVFCIIFYRYYGMFLINCIQTHTHGTNRYRSLIFPGFFFNINLKQIIKFSHIVFIIKKTCNFIPCWKGKEQQIWRCDYFSCFYSIYHTGSLSIFDWWKKTKKNLSFFLW